MEAAGTAGTCCGIFRGSSGEDLLRLPLSQKQRGELSAMHATCFPGQALPPAGEAAPRASA